MEYPCLAGQGPRCVPRFPGYVEGSLTDKSVGVLARQGLDSRSASHSLLSSQYTSAGELPSVDFESSSQRPSLDPLIRLKRLPHVRKKDQFQEQSLAVSIPLTDIHSKTMIQCDERCCPKPSEADWCQSEDSGQRLPQQLEQLLALQAREPSLPFPSLA